MKKVFILSSILVTGLFSLSQTTNKPTKPLLDTGTVTQTTLCLVLTNNKTGSSQTMWLKKIFGKVYEFPQLTNQQLRNDSLVLKKQIFEIKRYFVNIEEEVVDKITKKKKIQTREQEIPANLILIDFGNN